MAITKTTETGQIEIVGQYKHIQVRTDTVIKEDGKELSRTYHRTTHMCGLIDDEDKWHDTDLSDEEKTELGNEAMHQMMQKIIQKIHLKR